MRKWIHRGLKGLSLTTALFVFQACYGTPMTAPEEELIAVPETELVDEVLQDAGQTGELLQEGMEVTAE
ncbi:MAG: hypothetical protein IKX28_03705 [Bacteroidales bacterium]|nr:hypothetical protein [Bacteroidales bacterium]